MCKRDRETAPSTPMTSLTPLLPSRTSEGKWERRYQPSMFRMFTFCFIQGRIVHQFENGRTRVLGVNTYGVDLVATAAHDYLAHSRQASFFDMEAI